MQTQKYSQLKLFWELLKTDFFIYKKITLDYFINIAIWLISTVTIFAYIFPYIGMPRAFGTFVAVGCIASAIFWNTWTTSTIFLADIEGEKKINYFLTLPMPNTLILIKQIVSYAIKAGMPALFLLPLIKLFLWNSMSLANFSPMRFAIIFVFIAIFVGAFSLFITSFIKSMNHIENISMRFLFPLWFFSGANYPWQLLYSISPPFAYLSFLNPLLYAMEGSRAAILGQPGYLSFWICALMLIVFTGLFGYVGIIRLKRRLDFA